MNTRLQQFLTAENITQAQFADFINVARASVSHILAGRNKPGYDFIVNMMKCYPNLNVEWLLSGKGKMYKTTTADDLFSSASVPSAPTSYPSFAPAAIIPETTPPQEKIHDEQDAILPNIEFSETQEEVKEQENSTQSIVNQRKAVKIMIFYNDNTFEEFQK